MTSRHTIPLPDAYIEVIDNSVIKDDTELISTVPIYLMGFSSDKGPEDLQLVAGDNFFKLYGSKENIDFRKHGQPLIQAASSIEAGATLLCKRVVAKDAKLANITVYAQVKAQPRKVVKHKPDDHGIQRPVYEDPTKPTSDENEFTWDGGGIYIPKLIDDTKSRQSVAVRYFVKSDDSITSIKALKAKVNEERSGDIYPILSITDNGRGLSNKSFRIVPNYTTKVGLVKTTKHILQIIENNHVIEEMDFVYSPETKVKSVNLGINSYVTHNMKQIKIHQYEDSIVSLYEFIGETSKDDDNTKEEIIDYLQTVDGIFGRDNKMFIEFMQVVNSATDKLNITAFSGDEDKKVVNLSNPHGILLEGGTNGEFGDRPFGTEAYANALVDFFDGKVDESIYDLNKYKIDIIPDANYPLKVKNAIEIFTSTYRDDCMYLRDYGLGANSLQEIVQIHSSYLHDARIADYHLSYDILDPYSYRQIPVTSIFTLTKLFVNHFRQGRHRPCAGIPYDFVITDAIKGTESFIPTKGKFADQRATLNELGINYAIYYDDRLVIDTLYTSQEIYSQLSHINNVLNIQRIMKMLRTKAPLHRYTFTRDKAFEDYVDHLNRLLDNEAATFDYIKVKPLITKENRRNKQITIALDIACKDFNQSELFKFNVINLDDVEKLEK